MSSQMDEVFACEENDGDNNTDSGDVEQVAINTDSGCNLPMVSSSALSSMAKIMESDETGLHLNSAAAQSSVTEGDSYEPCDPIIIMNLFQSLSTTTNSLELQMKINLHVSIKYNLCGVQINRTRLIVQIVRLLLYLN